MTTTKTKPKPKPKENKKTKKKTSTKKLQKKRLYQVLADSIGMIIDQAKAC